MHYLYSRHYTTGSTFTVNYGKSFLYDFSMRFNSTSDGSYFSHCILDPSFPPPSKPLFLLENISLSRLIKVPSTTSTATPSSTCFDVLPTRSP